MPGIITSDILNKALGFDEYMALTNNLIQNPPAGSVYENPSTHRYTRSNQERMNKVLQNMVISQKLYNLLSGLKEEWVWVVISEPWCGDASWGTPAVYVISKCSELIDFKILLRDEHPDIMKRYQTAGSDSIPKLVCLRKNDLSEVGTWGPRPDVLHQMVLKWKDDTSVEYRERVRYLHAWYEEDMTKAIQDEFIVLLKEWMKD